jgi:arylformamidase
MENRFCWSHSPTARARRRSGRIWNGKLPELQRQSRDYHNARRHAVYLRLVPLDDHDHFSILEEMADPNGKLTGTLVRLAAS